MHISNIKKVVLRATSLSIYDCKVFYPLEIKFYITLRCVALRCVALRCVALRCVALCCIAFEYVCKFVVQSGSSWL
jgi:hypothetical protein